MEGEGEGGEGMEVNEGEEEGGDGRADVAME